MSEYGVTVAITSMYASRGNVNAVNVALPMSSAKLSVGVGGGGLGGGGLGGGGLGGGGLGGGGLGGGGLGVGGAPGGGYGGGGEYYWDTEKSHENDPVRA